MKAEVLKQMIVRKLLADKGRKLGYDREAIFIVQRAKVEDGLLAQKVLWEEISGKLTIDASDLKLYYEAHKVEFDEKSYDSVKQEVEARYGQLKQQEAVERMINDLYKVNNVKLFTSRLTDDSPAAAGTPTENVENK